MVQLSPMLNIKRVEHPTDQATSLLIEASPNQATNLTDGSISATAPSIPPPAAGSTCSEAPAFFQLAICLITTARRCSRPDPDPNRYPLLSPKAEPWRQKRTPASIGMTSANDRDPGGREHLFPTLPSTRQKPPSSPSPWRRKAASMAAVLPVDDGEEMLPVFPPPAEGSEHSCGLQWRASRRPGPDGNNAADPNPFSLCNMSKQLEIHWGDYFSQDTHSDAILCEMLNKNKHLCLSLEAHQMIVGKLDA
ncbi:uncharacterized protein LOC124657895 [Lolium rigidum]|uniref:uncharacterized protein LOC124657895 n=1 Tax=Lolium rigidum TaxID=89674 RepID=UPI001F5DD74B|nr:uncharacterized protein LOC124657895 [Lolium rigidum]